MPLISCPECEKLINLQASACFRCGYKLTREDKEIFKSKPFDSKTKGYFVNHEQGRTAIGALRFFAWVSLVVGILGAISIWALYGTTEIPFRSISGTYSEVNPIGIAIGIAVFLQGAFLCSFFHVIAYIAENLGFLLKRFEDTVIDKNNG